VQSRSGPLLTVAPDALVRFKSGRICVHTRSSKSQLSFGTPEILSVLAFFAIPRTRSDAGSEFVRLDPGLLATMIDDLLRIGALLPATTDAVEKQEPERDFELAGIHMASLAKLTYRAASCLAGLGPGLFEVPAQKGEIPICARIEAHLAAMDALVSEMNSKRDAHVAASLRRIGLLEQSCGLKLHIGAGPSPIDGWINIDAYPSELTLDIKWGLPFAAASADYVFMSHTLEHLFYPSEAIPVLKEIRRVLSAQGAVRIVVPDIEQWMHAYACHDEEFFAVRRELWQGAGRPGTPLEEFLVYAGAGPTPQSLFDSHKFGYDFETLKQALHRAGFTCVERSEYMRSSDPVLRVDSSSRVAGAMFRDRHYSLFVEARP
jgi:predicted SAM-dependent methyltransferase